MERGENRPTQPPIVIAWTTFKKCKKGARDVTRWTTAAGKGGIQKDAEEEET